jgi:type IV pilus assembly protein PilB
MGRTAAGIGDLLIREGLISSAQLDEALKEQMATRERLGEILTRRGYITQADLLQTLAGQLGHKPFDPNRDAIDPNALDLVSLEFARRHHVLPVRADEHKLVVAMVDPLDVEARDHLRRIAERDGRELEVLLATLDQVEETREANYSRIQGSRNVHELIDKVVDEAATLTISEGEADEGEAQRHAQDAGVIKLVEQIVAQALQERATDIHIEPLEKGLVIRFRVDGLLYDALTPPRGVYTGVITRVKILSNMDIAERRAPQDGRFTHRSAGREVDIRVSSIPTINGEKMVLRLLDKTGFNYSLRDLGFSQEDHEAFRRSIHNPYGMILLSGPTGSGKSTTLYASLLELRDQTLNITTIEDPVEYQMARINQVQVNERKQVTFAKALRSFLRQDPDVIMVGEIRDQETAEMAVRAALTGHMVFSTIHANDAPGTAVRLVSMGAESFMTASALTLVAAQRLVRRNCRHCLEEYRPASEVLLALGGSAWLERESTLAHFQRGSGCAACNGRGYHGRVAVIERMVMSPALRQLVAENRPANELRRVAIAEGMVPLRQSGLRAAIEGMTTVEEVLRVCLSDE